MANDSFSSLAFSGLYEDALAACKASVADVSHDHAASFISGYCLFHLSRPAEAAHHFSRALQLAPGDTFAMSYLVQALSVAGDADQAIARATDYIQQWHGDCASGPFSDIVQAGLTSLAVSSNPSLRSGFVSALKTRSAEVPDSKTTVLPAATLIVEGLDATRRYIGSQSTNTVCLAAGPIITMATGVANGLGEMLWQDTADTIRFAEFEGAPVATTTGVRATVAGYPAYVAELRDVLVCAKSSAVFGPGDEILSDTYADPRFGASVDLRADATIIARSGDAAIFSLAKPTRRLDRAISLVGPASKHFGHWAAEFLPRMRHIARLDNSSDIAILVNDDMPRAHYEFLALLCDNPLVRIAQDDVVQVARLIVAPTIGFFPFDLLSGHSVPLEEQASWSGPAMRYMRDRVFASLGNQPAAEGEAIYLSRESSSWGRPLNEDDLLAQAPALGLRPVRLETMPFAEQVRTIQQASTIVAPAGSALNMLMFANYDTKLLIFSQKYPHNWGGWVGPLREIGLNPCMIMATTGDPVSKHASYGIDIDLVRTLLLNTAP
ncbi:glycosyltransferase 61 family protein [Rhizobium sp. R86522]|uniref:glycosyltransferase family 61 protein n=1 Tax=Rhizobium sp. R86522 TaxID=3093861 RepID=UPI003670B356